MTSPARVRLADVTPPSRSARWTAATAAAVAPLVDHLSEAALNRERVHVEVEWLIHLTRARRRARVPRR